MKRRQFGTMLATATLSLGGLTGAVTSASAQNTEPLVVEDVNVSLGEGTTSLGLVELEYEDGGRIELDVEDWTMEGGTRSLAIGEAQVAVEGQSEETYAAVRSAMIEAFQGRSLSPLLEVLAAANVNPDGTVEVSAGPVEMDGQLVADQIAAVGTAGSVVPDGMFALVQEGASLQEISELGTSQWDGLVVVRGDSQLQLDNPTMQLSGTTFAITSPDAVAETPGRSLAMSDVTMLFGPPETVSEPHRLFAARLRQLAADGSLTLSAIRSAAAESGVTAANTVEFIRASRFALGIGEVTEDGETVVSDFETAGTLAELMAAIRQQA